MEFNREKIEKTPRNELIAELKNIASLAFPGSVAKQNAEKIVMFLRLSDKKITREQYDDYWNGLKGVN